MFYVYVTIYYDVVILTTSVCWAKALERLAFGDFLDVVDFCYTGLMRIAQYF